MTSCLLPSASTLDLPDLPDKAQQGEQILFISLRADPIVKVGKHEKGRVVVLDKVLTPLMGLAKCSR